MTRYGLLMSLLLPVLLMGCAPDADLQVLQANTVAIERQSSARYQTVEARVQQLSERLAQFERTQAETRRAVARVSATVDELRGQLQILQGALQETQHQALRSPAGEEGAAVTKLTALDTRLRALARRLSASSP